MLGVGPRTRKIPWQLHDGFWTPVGPGSGELQAPVGQCTPCQRSGRRPGGTWPGSGARGRHSHPVIPALATKCRHVLDCGPWLVLPATPVTHVRRLAVSASRICSHASRVNMKPSPAGTQDKVGLLQNRMSRPGKYVVRCKRQGSSAVPSEQC